MKEWSHKIEYLMDSRYKYHNQDYLEFLVQRVWRIHEKVNIVDFGCGYGYLGLSILPLLPKGSYYTGIDESPELIKKGREVFAELGIDATFECLDALNTPYQDNTFDVSMCHAFLMHQPSPSNAIAEMKRVTKGKGLLITCETNRNAVNALKYIHGLEKSTYCNLGFLQELFDSDRLNTGKDCNIGTKLPALLNEAGLSKVEARMTDSCKCYLPSDSNDDNRKLYASIRADITNQIGSELRGRMLKRFLDRGFSQEEAEEQISREVILSEKMNSEGDLLSIVMPTAMTFVYGTVEKEEANIYMAEEVKRK